MKTGMNNLSHIKKQNDTGEQRAAALDSFNKNLDQFIKKIEEIVASATSG